MGNPVGVLRTMRRLAGTDGAVIVMDERVGDRFTATGNDVEWMMYGWSVTWREEHETAEYVLSTFKSIGGLPTNFSFHKPTLIQTFVG